MQQTHVIELAASPARTGFAGGLGNASGQSIDAEEVFSRTTFGKRTQKRRVAAAEIDMQRGNASEDFREIEAGDVGLRDELDHGEKLRQRRSDAITSPLGTQRIRDR
jgi:hypothetical protein